MGATCCAFSAFSVNAALSAPYLSVISEVSRLDITTQLCMQKGSVQCEGGQFFSSAVQGEVL